jgi:hypothetical protein
MSRVSFVALSPREQPPGTQPRGDKFDGRLAACCLVFAATGAQDLRLFPLFFGGEDDASVSVAGVEPPRDISLAVELILAGAGEGHSIGGIWANGVGRRDPGHCGPGAAGGGSGGLAGWG